MAREKDPDVRSRRKKMCALRFRGMPLDRVAERMAATYDLSEEYVKQDWYKRKNWLPELLDISINDARLQLMDIIAEEKEVKNELWNIKRENNSPNIKISALKQIRDSNERIIDIFKDMGIIEKDGGINIQIQNTNAEVSVEEKEASVADEIEKYRDAIRNIGEKGTNK